jgi:DNA-binding CsgD family transcriptional regulator
LTVEKGCKNILFSWAMGHNLGQLAALLWGGHRPKNNASETQPDARRKTMRSSRLANKLKQDGKRDSGEASPNKMRLLNRSETGFLLLNAALEPLYMNTRAAEILFHPDKPNRMKDFSNQLTARIRTMIANGGPPSGVSVCREFLSGRRHYVCQLLDAHLPGNSSRGSSLALLLERSAGAKADTAKVCLQYHLTQREAEAVQLLVLGLASKEIAARMGISPNTVKVFLRLAMVKMGVSSRSGIMSKFISPRPESV